MDFCNFCGRELGAIIKICSCRGTDLINKVIIEYANDINTEFPRRCEFCNGLVRNDYFYEHLWNEATDEENNAIDKIYRAREIRKKALIFKNNSSARAKKEQTKKS